jgi:hypothetical protein
LWGIILTVDDDASTEAGTGEGMGDGAGSEAVEDEEEEKEALSFIMVILGILSVCLCLWRVEEKRGRGSVKSDGIDILGLGWGGRILVLRQSETEQHKDSGRL